MGKTDDEMDRKGKGISVAQRQIYILSLLSENPKGYTALDIQHRLMSWDVEVSKRTITRDIDELSLDYAIEEEERGGKTYYYANKYTLKNVDLTIHELASLAFAKTMLGEYEHLHMGKTAMQFIDKVVEGSAALNKLQFEKLCGQIGQPGKKIGNHDIVDEKIERVIQSAIDNKNKLEINYYSYSGDESTCRVIHPYRMLLLDSYINVEAYCELRKEIRRFRLSRIETIEVLDQHFEEMKKDAVEAFLNLSGTQIEEMELLFTGAAVRYVKEYEKSRAKNIRESEEGLHFYRETAITEDVVRWIRGFGPDVKVIKPLWLENQLKEEAKEILGI